MGQVLGAWRVMMSFTPDVIITYMPTLAEQQLLERA
jgi:hypothetical protein